MKKTMLLLSAAGALALAGLAPGTASAGWRHHYWGGPGVGVYVGPRYGYYGYPAYGAYPTYTTGYYPYAAYPYWRTRHFYRRHYGWY